jgi:hypothetical protein
MAALALACAALLLAACGGGADEDTDPQELLQETFSGEGQVNSGVLEISIDASAEGRRGGSLAGTLSGPFQTREQDQLPLIDLDAALDFEAGGSQAQSIQAGLTVTEDAAFVTAEGQAFEVDQATFSAFQSAFAQSAEAQTGQADEGAAIFEQLGIDPRTWLTDVSNEGTEDVGGTETIHISGTPDVGRILTDAQELDPTGNAAPGNEGELAESVESASIDIYTGSEDKILRRMDLALELTESGRQNETISFALSIGISDVNEEQTIEAPADARPLEELIPGGLGGLEQLGEEALGGGAGPGLDSLGGSPEYRECVATAQSPDELADCAKLL